ncbi:ribokinase [Agreia sp. PsM10]|uniref:ribokinase n=1 Tax=Agreia sp. PsM10 TaxID=3030533 RepID=UPI00263B0AD7|nr:ribokinase [Agreia sp. PsM10]MDN4640034.1 ribokinase [Agreia sp. PsM10]
MIGSANMDLSVRQPRPARPGETLFGSSFVMGAGGKGLNQAIAASRGGADVRFLGAVGNDPFAESLRATLVDNDVDVTGLRSTDQPTGVAQISVTDDGQNSIVVVSGANNATDFADEDRAAIAASGVLVAQFERPVSLVREAFMYARSLGITTVLTPAPVVGGSEELIALTDLLVANEQEAIQLAGMDDVAGAAERLGRDARNVIVTLGERGSLLYRRTIGVRYFPAPHVSAVDTTAAGDTFVGVVTAWLAAGEQLETAISAASAAAAITVTRRGAVTSMPYREEILAAMELHER